MPTDVDQVFKALADRTRRQLLDRLHEHNGQTLRDLCEGLDMARQSTTQHVAVLEAANLVSTVRRGRQKFHYLNPVPLHEIQERWIDKFERPRLRALSAIRHRAEEAMTDLTDLTGTRDLTVTSERTDMTDLTETSKLAGPATTSEKPSFVYVTYIVATADAVWHALTDADLTASYWGHANVSDWEVGSSWAHQRIDGSGINDVVGTVVVSEPPRRLVTTWVEPHVEDAADGSRVTFDIEAHDDIVRLTVTHENLADENAHRDVSGGWPAVMSNLKSLLETGHPLPQSPWEMSH